MNPIFLFIVGPPAVGKTTLVRRLLEPDSWFSLKPKWTVGKHVCAAGHYVGETFDGADTVPYNGVAVALAWWESNLKDRSLTIFDGDRFSHEKVVSWCKERAPVKVIHLGADAATLAARRAGRGSNQNPSWMKGRETKARRFADANDGVFIEGDTLAIADRVKAILS